MVYNRVVTHEDTAKFEAGEVHPVYATFALGRDAEWVCRLFVLEMKEEDEEGIGTYLHITHHSPAFIGDQVFFEAKIKAVNGHEVIAIFEARVGDRLIASGETGQKILKKSKIEEVFKRLR